MKQGTCEVQENGALSVNSKNNRGENYVGKKTLQRECEVNQWIQRFADCHGILLLGKGQHHTWVKTLWLAYWCMLWSEHKLFLLHLKGGQQVSWGEFPVTYMIWVLSVVCWLSVLLVLAVSGWEEIWHGVTHKGWSHVGICSKHIHIPLVIWCNASSSLLIWGRIASPRPSLC